MTKLIKHHIKYKELHGVDKIVLMTRSEHKKLHNRLRKEGKCNVSSDELAKISQAASNRAGVTKEYTDENIQRHSFFEPMMKYINLFEEIRYNNKLGTLYICSWFAVNKRKKIFYIDID